MSEIIQLPLIEALKYAHPLHWDHQPGSRLPEMRPWPVADDKATWSAAFNLFKKVIDGQLELKDGVTYTQGERFRPAYHLPGSIVSIDSEMLIVYGPPHMQRRNIFQDISPPTPINIDETGLALGESRLFPIPLFMPITVSDVEPRQKWSTFWYVRHHALGVVVKDMVSGKNTFFRTVRWPHEKTLQLIQNPPTKTKDISSTRLSLTVGSVKHYTFADTGVSPAQLLMRDNCVTFLHKPPLK